MDRSRSIHGSIGANRIIRGRRLAVQHVLGMLAAGDDHDTLLRGCPWQVREDILACLLSVRRGLLELREDDSPVRHSTTVRYRQAAVRHANPGEAGTDYL